LVLLLVAIRLSGLHVYFQEERIRSAIEAWGRFGPLLYIGMFAVLPSLFLPGLPMTVAGGLAFGPLWGTVYASIGSTLGAMLAFLVARYFARESILKLLGTRWEKIDQQTARHGWVYVAITRLIPLFPFNVLNYAFGLTQIDFLPYAAVSWLCMLPATAAYVVFSSSIFDLLHGKISLPFLMGLLLLLGVSLIPWGYRKWTGSPREDS
jgi:uncharacterized membrane protein YdjX (TVP38/TMEM64 family)